MIPIVHPTYVKLAAAVLADEPRGVERLLSLGDWSSLPQAKKIEFMKVLILGSISLGSPKSLKALLDHDKDASRWAQMDRHMSTAANLGRVEMCALLAARGWSVDAQKIGVDLLKEKMKSSGRRVPPFDLEKNQRFLNVSSKSVLTWGSLLNDSFEWFVSQWPHPDHPRKLRGRHQEMTLLMMAGDARCAQFLLARGADPNARDAKGWTPLAHALQGGVQGWIKALVAAGADLGAVAPGADAVSFANIIAKRPVAGDWALSAAREEIARATGPGHVDTGAPTRVRL
jgi:hypothetical protein